MKKILTIIALAICSMTMMAETLHVGDLYYDITAIEGGYAAKIVYDPSYTELDSIEIPNYITYRGLDLPIIIGANAFNQCTKLAYVLIPYSVIGIEYDAFWGTALYDNPANWDNGALTIDGCLIKASEYIPTNYRINNFVRLIADYAFHGCKSLKTVTIPNSVRWIGDAAFFFNGCNDHLLDSIRFDGTKKQWNWIKKNEYWLTVCDELDITIHCKIGKVKY
jgi:hypothetical protein